MKRFLFDIDGTILERDYTRDMEFFKKELNSEEGNIVVPRINELIKEYQKAACRCEVSYLSMYLSNSTGVEITPELIYKWREFISSYDSKVVPGAKDLLFYLSVNASQNVVGISNWFADDQMRRLEKCGLLKYFNNFYGGDFFLKPTKEFYLNAAGRFPKEDCVVIGDSLEEDVYGPYRVGMDAIYFDREKKGDANKKLVKSYNKLGDIMRRY